MKTNSKMSDLAKHAHERSLLSKSKTSPRHTQSVEEYATASAGEAQGALKIELNISANTSQLTVDERNHPVDSIDQMQFKINVINIDNALAAKQDEAAGSLGPQS